MMCKVVAATAAAAPHPLGTCAHTNSRVGGGGCLGPPSYGPLVACLFRWRARPLASVTQGATLAIINFLYMALLFTYGFNLRVFLKL